MFFQSQWFSRHFVGVYRMHVWGGEGTEIGLLHFIELFTPRQGLELALGRSAGMAIWNLEEFLRRGLKLLVQSINY